MRGAPAVALAVLLAAPAFGEKGVLVLQVSDLQGRPLAGVVLATAGDGSTAPPTTREGKTRLHLAPATEPGDLVTLQVVPGAKDGPDRVFVSPWDARVSVPRFENRADNFAAVVLAERADRALLENPKARRALAQTALKEQSPRTLAEAAPEAALARTGEIFGLPPEEVRRALAAWKPRDPYDRALKAFVDGEYGASADLAARSIQEREKKLEEDRKALAEAYFLAGESLYQDGRYGPAADAFEKGLAHWPDDPELLGQLGLALVQNGDFDGARTRFQRVLTLAAAAGGAEPAEALFARLNLASTLRLQGELPEARRLVEQVLPRMQQQLGEESPDALNAASLLAVILQQQGDLAGARARFEALLPRIRKALGERAQETVAAENNLALVLADLGDFEGARQLLRHVIDVWKEDLGPDHPLVLTAQVNLTAALFHLGRLREARESGEAAVRSLRRVLGREHPETLAALEMLASIERKQGDLDAARALFEEVLEIRRRPPFGEGQRATLATLGGLTLVLRDRGDPAAARALLEKALATALGPPEVDALLTANLRDQLAVTLRMQGDLPHARELEEQALAGCRSIQGDTGPDTLTALEHLAAILRDQGDLDGARQRLETVVEARRRLLGPRHADTSAAEWALASTLRDQGRPEAARPFLEALRWLLAAAPEDLSREQREIAARLPPLLVASP